MWGFVKTFIVLGIAQSLAGCTQRFIDVEPLPDGGYLVRSSASTLSEPAGTVNSRVTQEATKFCRRDGRIAKVREIKTQTDSLFGKETAEAEFECTSVSGRSQIK